MGSKKTLAGRGFVASHTTAIDGAVPVIEALRKEYSALKILPGVIETGIRARSFSIKLLPDENVTNLTVVTNNCKQVFILYNAPTIEKMVGYLRDQKKLCNFRIQN